MRRRLPFILLAAVLLLSFSLNARMAANPRDDYQSADERAYGKLALDIADNRHYGSPSTNMREPLHWPPGRADAVRGRIQAVRLRQRQAGLQHRRRLLAAGADHDRDDRARDRAGLDPRRAMGRAARRADRRHLPAADRRHRRPAVGAVGRVPAARRVRRARPGGQAEIRPARLRRRGGAVRADDPHAHGPAARPVPDRRLRRRDRALQAALAQAGAAALGDGGVRRRASCSRRGRSTPPPRRAASSRSPRAARPRCSSAPTCRAAAPRWG